MPKLATPINPESKNPGINSNLSPIVNHKPNPNNNNDNSNKNMNIKSNSPINSNQAFLLSSSCLFNQKRIQQAKIREKQQEERQQRLFDGLEEDVSREIVFGQRIQSDIENYEEKCRDNNDNSIHSLSVSKDEQWKTLEHLDQFDNIVKKQYNAIDQIITQLSNLKNGLKQYENAYKRMNQTDLSEQDQKFVAHLLHQHGYIDKIKPNMKINQIFTQLRTKLKQKHANQEQNNHENKCKIQSILEPQLLLPSLQLQNFKKSRKPQQYLCSIANQLQSKLLISNKNSINYKILNNTNNNRNNIDWQKNQQNHHHSRQKQHQQKKCSLQLDLDLIEHFNTHLNTNTNSINSITNKNHYIKESKRYQTQNSIYQCEQNNEHNEQWGYQKQQQMHEEQSGMQKQKDQQKSMKKLDQFPKNKIHLNDNIKINQIQSILAKVQLPQTKTIKGNIKFPTLTHKYSQPQTPRKWQKQSSTPNNTPHPNNNNNNNNTNFNNFNNNSTNSLILSQVHQQYFVGFIGNLQCQIYYQDVKKLCIKRKCLYLEVGFLGFIEIIVNDNDKSQEEEKENSGNERLMQELVYAIKQFQKQQTQQ